MVPKQVWYRFPGIGYCIISIQRGKVPNPTYNWAWLEARWKPFVYKLQDFDVTAS